MNVPEIFYHRAIELGFTIEAACSLLANIQGESAFRCNNAEDRINRVISDEEYIRRADAGLLTYNGKNFIFEEIMHQLVWVWENPANKEGAMNERLPYARSWYAKFTNWYTPAEEITQTNTSTVTDSDGIAVDKTWPPRTIQNGLNWTETYLLQSLLKCHGYNVLICGVFAESLERKVKEFQQDNGLKADGIVGPKTWKKLMAFPPDF